MRPHLKPLNVACVRWRRMSGPCSPAHRTYLRDQASCLGLAASLKGATMTLAQSLLAKADGPAACLASQVKNPASLTFSAFDDDEGEPSSPPLPVPHHHASPRPLAELFCSHRVRWQHSRRGVPRQLLRGRFSCTGAVHAPAAAAGLRQALQGRPHFLHYEKGKLPHAMPCFSAPA